MEYTATQLLWLFLIYAFLGWCCEIGYCGLKEGHFVNRGFLNGPWCPIYGAGGVLIILCLTPVSNGFVLLFLGSFGVCSLIELATGWGLEKMYHARWWDYSDKKFNVGGYICLEFSVIWGFFGIFLMKILHPFIFMIVGHMCGKAGIIVLICVCAVFMADLIVTIMTVRHIGAWIKSTDEIAGAISGVTEKIARNVYGGAVRIEELGRDVYNNDDVQEFIEKTQTKGRVMQKRTDFMIAQFRSEHEDELDELADRLNDLRSRYSQIKNESDDNLDELKTKLNSLKAKYSDSVKGINILQRRVLRAFPKLEYKKYPGRVKKLIETAKKEKLSNKNNQK